MPNDDMVQALMPKQGLAADVAGYPQRAGGYLSQFLGIDDAARALRGEMTPDEQQGFFMSQLPNLIPESKLGFAAALKLLPREITEPYSERFLESGIGSWANRYRDAFSNSVNAERSADSLYANNAPNSRSFDIINDNNQGVGRLWTSYYDPKKLYVDYIAALDPKSGLLSKVTPDSFGPGTLGTKEMMSLIPELKKHFPEAESLEGYRLSGARRKSGAIGDVKINLKR